MAIANQNVVLIDYTLKNDAGDVLDTSDGREPLAFIQGVGNIIPGLEKALEGKVVGDKVDATIAPDDAYGTRMDELVQSIPMTSFPEPEQVKVGVQFQLDVGEGVRIATVMNIENDEVTIDMNHPLAGETLHFAVEVKEIRDATEEELSHGHVHGVGGHQH